MSTTHRMAWIFVVAATLLGPSPEFCHSEEDNWIVEPHQTLHLSIDNQSHKLETDKPTTVAIDGQERSVSITSDRYRTFKTDSLSFDYPSTFRYRREKIEAGDDKIHFCRLDGDGIVVRIGEQTPKLDFTSFASYFREKHSMTRDGVTITETRKEFETANATLDEMTFVMNGKLLEKPFFQVDRCFLIPSGNKDTCIILAASISSGPPSDEANDFIATLEKTLKVAAVK